MLKCIVVLQKGAVGLPVLPGHKGFIAGQLLVQSGLLRLNLLNQTDHRGVVRGHNVGQGQPVDVRQRMPDFLQPPLADHIFVHNGPCVGVDIMDAEHRQEIGQQGHQAQQDDGQNQALLQRQLVSHTVSSHVY